MSDFFGDDVSEVLGLDDEDVSELDDPDDPESFEPVSFGAPSFEPESFDDDSPLPDDDVDDFLPRLSVLKKPEPLNVTPTGVKTFLTGNTSPESGWAISVRVSSWNPWWTSMVSPVSTNL